MIFIRNQGKVFASAAAGLAALAGGTARAAEADIVPIDELWDAYQAICVAHPGDQPGQIAAAKAAPYNFTENQTSDDGSIDLRNGRIVLSLLDNSKDHFCMVLAPVDPKTTAQDAIRVAQPVIGKPKQVETLRAVWALPGNNPPTIHLFRTKESESHVLLGGFVQGTM